MTNFEFVLAFGLVACAIEAAWQWSRARSLDRELTKAKDMERWLADMVEALSEGAAAERRELYTRIQAWDAGGLSKPEPSEPKPPAAEADEEDPGAAPSHEELMALGLVENEAGGYIDARTGVLYENLTAYKSYMAYLAKHNLPVNTKPDDMKYLAGLGGNQ